MTHLLGQALTFLAIHPSPKRKHDSLGILSSSIPKLCRPSYSESDSKVRRKSLSKCTQGMHKSQNFGCRDGYDAPSCPSVDIMRDRVKGKRQRHDHDMLHVLHIEHRRYDTNQNSRFLPRGQPND